MYQNHLKMFYYGGKPQGKGYFNECALLVIFPWWKTLWLGCFFIHQNSFTNIYYLYAALNAEWVCFMCVSSSALINLLTPLHVFLLCAGCLCFPPNKANTWRREEKGGGRRKWANNSRLSYSKWNAFLNEHCLRNVLWNICLKRMWKDIQHHVCCMCESKKNI